jgi:hypothetical protein
MGEKKGPTWILVSPHHLLSLRLLLAARSSYLNSCAARTLSDLSFLFCFALCRLICLWLMTYVTYVFYLFFGRFFSAHWRSNMQYDPILWSNPCSFSCCTPVTQCVTVSASANIQGERERELVADDDFRFVCLSVGCAGRPATRERRRRWHGRNLI